MQYQMLDANVRVYDQLRCQSVSVSRYTKATQSDNIRNLIPSDRPKGAHEAKRSN
jgi:hypothetical protein